MLSQIIDYSNPNPLISAQQKPPRKFKKPPENWFSKIISKPNLIVPIATLTIFAIFFGYNFAFRTGGAVSSSVASFSNSENRSITPRRVFSLSKELEFEANTLNHILITGQSLAVGETGIPALSDFQPYANLRINNGRIEALIENITLPGFKLKSESIGSGFANHTTFNSKNQKYQVIISNNGRGGAKYESLKKGTELYQKNLNEVKIAAEYAKSQNLKYQVKAIFVIHGESDNQAGNGSNYQGFLQEWQKDYNQDIQSLTGQKDDIYLFTDQLSSFGNIFATKEKSDPATALAQLAASKNPQIVLVAPKYFLDYTDNLHLNNFSYRKLGEYYAKAYGQTILQNKKWEPVRPIDTKLDGNIIKIKFEAPKLPLVLDTSSLQRENYGFRLSEKGPNPAKIQKVQINNDTVEITLDKPPKNAKIQYALDAIYNAVESGGGTGNNRVGAAAGNLRDSDQTPSIYGNNLSNWAVHFEEILE